MNTALAESSTSKPEADVSLDSRIEWLTEILRMPADRVVSEAIELWPNLQSGAWRMSFFLKRIKDEELWRPYGSFSEWAEKALRRSSGNVSKYLTSANFVLLDCETDEEREQAMQATPLQLAEAGIPKLAKTDKAEALKLASSGKTTSQLKQAVRVREPHQHYDKDELATFRVVVGATQKEKLLGMWNWARFRCETPQPTDSEIADLVTAEFFGGIHADEVLLERFPLADIVSGHVKCIECGATNGNGLEGHHVCPKGKARQRPDEDNEGPRVWLCHEHHRVVTENIAGTWFTYLEGWMARKDMEWLREAVEMWARFRFGSKLHVPGQLVGYFGLREEAGSA